MTGRRSAPDLALHVLQRLWLGGVRDVVLAPGSRSAPFALALDAADRDGDLRLHVRVDERSAGFLALGLTTGSRRVCCDGFLRTRRCERRGWRLAEHLDKSRRLTWNSPGRLSADRNLDD